MKPGIGQFEKAFEFVFGMVQIVLRGEPCCGGNACAPRQNRAVLNRIKDRIGTNGNVVLGKGGTRAKSREDTRTDEGFSGHDCAFSGRSLAGLATC